VKIRAIVTGIISYLILILVGIIIVNALLVSAGPVKGWSTSANATWVSVTSYIWIGFGLLAIIPLILVAAYMMGILGGAGAGRGA
jgi:hypothetical protein